MSDALLPVPPEDAADAASRAQAEDLAADRGPDVLPGPGADEVAAAAHADQPDRFRTPRPGDRLTAADLEAELD